MGVLAKFSLFGNVDDHEMDRLFLFCFTQTIYLVQTCVTFLFSTVIKITLMESNSVVISSLYFFFKLELIVNSCLSKCSNMSKQNLILRYKLPGLSAWITFCMFIFFWREKYGPWCVYLGVGTGREDLQWSFCISKSKTLKEENSSMIYILLQFMVYTDTP